MARVLVTGGLGFIGKNLCKRLLLLGHEVVSLDDKSASAADAEGFILAGIDRRRQKFSSVVGSVLD